MSRIKVKLIPPESTYNIRNKVLWPHKKLENCNLSIDKLHSTFHFGSYLDNNLISIGTFLKEKNINFNTTIKQYRLRAMGTLKLYEGNNGGKYLIDFAKKYLKEKNIDLIWCDAREIAIPFYKKIGFKSTGNIYEIPIIGRHKLMYIYI